MTGPILLEIPAVLAVAATAGALALAVPNSPRLVGIWNRYTSWFAARLAPEDPEWMRSLPAGQAFVLGVFLSIWAWLSFAPAIPIAAGLAMVPPLMISRRRAARSRVLESQLDSTLSALANALSTTPNLGDALASIEGHLDPPMRDEVSLVLAQTKLGKPIDDALMEMSRRANAPGFEPAIAAAVMGRRTGGNLVTILDSTARTLREIARLEGVVKTKTAEGRNQALVMGLVPPVLVAALNKIDPAWLEPMWKDPIGWVLLGAACVLEIVAVVLIKKIMAVDI